MKRTKSTTMKAETREEYMEGGGAKRDEDDFGQSTNTRSSSPSSHFPRLTLVDDGPNVCISQDKNVSRTLRGKKSKLR